MGPCMYGFRCNQLIRLGISDITRGGYPRRNVVVRNTRAWFSFACASDGLIRVAFVVMHEEWGETRGCEELSEV